MNGTMFLNSLGSQEDKLYKNKCEKKDVQDMGKSDIVGLPLNLLPNGEKQDDSKIGLYRPIPSSGEEEFGSFGWRNMSSPAPDVLKLTQENYTFTGNTMMFDRFSQLSSELFVQNNYSNHQTNGSTYFNNNYRSNNNNHYTKNRANHQSNNTYSNNNNHTREPRRRYYRSHSDPMIRRVYGLSHRLRSKSTMLKIDPNPQSLLNGGPYDQLSKSIYDIYMEKSQKMQTYEDKIQLWQNLFLCIRKCISQYALYIVGSTMTGFGLNNSDVDMCLLIKPCTEDPRLNAVHQLFLIRNYLVNHDLICCSELVMAKVPILKFREQAEGFEIDLNCNNSVGIYNTHLLYCYALLDWRVRPLVVMLKLWAQANGINDAKNLSVSSYSWTLMMINYLQCGVSPAVLPCLHNLYPDHFNAEKCKITDVHEEIENLENYESFNTQSLAELFIGFFGHYSNFDFNQYAVSVRVGAHLLVEDCKQVKAPKNDQNQWKYLCIEEPFDYTNTARSVYDIAAFRKIKATISNSYDELIKTKKINSVLPVKMGTKNADLVC